MPLGEQLVYATARTAMALYLAALVVPASSPWRRRLWTAGWLIYLSHVAAAFHFVHDWSHADAAVGTARRAASVAGRPVPEGIYYNYAFTLVWTIDVAWLWLAPRRYAARPRLVSWLIHGFMLFMAVNAVVLFGQGPTRWLGAAGFALLAVVTARRLRLKD